MSSDASGTWEGQDLTKAKRALISVTSFLSLLTIFYAAFIFCADSWQITSAGLAAAVLIAITAWLLSRRWPDQAVPSEAAEKFVGITSGIEGIAITVAFILGAFDLWWLFLPLVLTSVSLHFTSMLIAYRRVVDWFIVPVAFAATALAWSAGTTDFFNTWAIAGGMLSGCCAGYPGTFLGPAKALCLRARRRGLAELLSFRGAHRSRDQQVGDTSATLQPPADTTPSQAHGPARR